MISCHWIPTHRGTVGTTPDRDIFARWQPPFFKTICVDETVPYLEDIPPAATIVVRNHPLSEMHDLRGLSSAAYAGQVGHDHAVICERMMLYCEARGVSRSRLLFEGLNEPQLWAGEPGNLVALYYTAFLQGLHAWAGHGVIGNFGVGWPSNGGVENAPVDWAFFRPALAAMTPGDYLGLHEYWALNGPGENWRWWAGRWLQCPFDVPILITECGIDTGVTGNWYGGWRNLPEATTEAKAARYVNELWAYATACAQDKRVRGVFPFTYDIGSKEWEKFDIRDTVFLNAFFARLDAVGLPQPGGGAASGYATLAESVRGEAEKHDVLRINPATALCRAGAAAGLWPTSNEYAWTFDGVSYTGQRFRNPRNDAVTAFYCVTGQWATVMRQDW